MNEKDTENMKNFFIGLGASIMGGAVTGYVILHNPDWATYILLVVVGGAFALFGLLKRRF